MPILIHGNSKVPELQQKNVKSTTVQQEITPSEGYDGFNKIIVSPIKQQEKTATPGTSEQVITPDSTYDGLSKVTVEAVKSVVQATPAITVATNGLITALATQSAGYVSAGTKSTTKQMTTQAGTTINPGTSRKLAVQSSRYTTGDIYVAGDSNLVADNIKKGVSIFGVSGSYEGNNGSVSLIMTGATPTSATKLVVEGLLSDAHTFFLVGKGALSYATNNKAVVLYYNSNNADLDVFISVFSNGAIKLLELSNAPSYFNAVFESGTLTITASKTQYGFATDMNFTVYYLNGAPLDTGIPVEPA